jgi:hypothetical protein
MRQTIQVLGIAIVAISIYLFFFNKPPKPLPGEVVYIDGKPYPVEKRIIDSQYFAKWETKFVKGDTMYRDTTIYVEVPAKVDTNAILRSFFAKNVYRDTLKLSDSLGFVFVGDTISQNKILSRHYVAKINQKRVYEIVILDKPAKAQVYFGFGAAFDKNYINNINTNLLFKSKSNMIYGLGTGIDMNKNIFINTSVYWKIGKK